MKERFLIIGTALWIVSTMLLLVFFPDLASILWILIYGVQLLFLAFGAGMLVLAAIRIRRAPLVASLCALVILGGFAFSFTIGRSWGERTRFALVRPSYEKRLQEILQSYERGTPIKSRYAQYEIDLGPPVRVAFTWQAGVTDNWVGLVYDPTGIVMNANQFKRDQSNWNEPSLAHVKHLFGGDIFQTRHLKDNWYLCFFT